VTPTTPILRDGLSLGGTCHHLPTNQIRSC